jgi:hypothetical protein
MLNYLSPDELPDALTIRDLPDSSTQSHAMQALLLDIIDALGKQWDVPERIIRHSPLVRVSDNFDNLGFNASDVTRDRTGPPESGRDWLGDGAGPGPDAPQRYSRHQVLRSTDRRIEQQMMDLSPWNPSPCRRPSAGTFPLSCLQGWAPKCTETALGERAEDLENVELLALTPYAELPSPARERLQIREGQASALIRLVLRPLTGR